ncbi:MAG: methyltransferase domain-containing protein [Magnetospirillum sp.]|nr:methyltransferase domain-containing protein [Magnetospirillum sp.]
MNRTHRISSAFSAAAPTYDGAAQAQAHSAEILAGRILELPLPPSPCVLEVGCGTGLLTRRLLPAVGGRWTVTDLAPAMVAAARRAIPEAEADFRVMDGENPDIVPGGVDLIVSNLAAQWFSDLPAALAALIRCLAPGGALILTTLGAGSFAEWRQAHDHLSLPCGIPPYPTAAALAAMLPGGTRVNSRKLRIPYADGFAFLRALRAIGADTPAEGYTPLSAGALRRVVAALGRPCAVTYEVLTVEHRR